MKKYLVVIIIVLLVFAVSCTNNSSATNIQDNKTTAAEPSDGKTPAFQTPENTESDELSGTLPLSTDTTPVYSREFDWESVPQGQVEPYNPEYDSNDIFETRKNDQYIGYKNGKKIYQMSLSNKNKDILYPLFKDAGYPSGDIYNINIAQNMGFLNGKLEKIVDEKYNDYITYTYDDSGNILTVNAGSYLFDAKGNILLDKTEYRLSGNTFGYAFITDGSKYHQEESNKGLFNLKTGKIQIPCIYHELRFVSPEVLYSEKYIYVKESDSWEQVSGYIDVNGKMLTETDPKMKAVNKQKSIYEGNDDIVSYEIDGKKVYNVDIELYEINGKLVYKVAGYKGYSELKILDDKFNVLISVVADKCDIFPRYGKALFRKENKIQIYDFKSKKTSEMIIDENDLKNDSPLDTYISIQYSNNFLAVSVMYYNSKASVFNDPYECYTNYSIIYNYEGKKIFSKADSAEISADGKYMWVSDDLYKGYIDSKGNWVYKEKRFTNLFD